MDAQTYILSIEQAGAETGDAGRQCDPPSLPKHQASESGTEDV